MVLSEDMKLIGHVLLHPISVLSPDVCMQTLCYKVIFILLNTLKLLMSISLQKTDLTLVFIMKPRHSGRLKM